MPGSISFPYCLRVRAMEGSMTEKTDMRCPACVDARTPSPVVLLARLSVCGTVDNEEPGAHVIRHCLQVGEPCCVMNITRIHTHTHEDRYRAVRAFPTPGLYGAHASITEDR